MGCPDENALLRFARGGAADAEVAALEPHLDSCASCRQAVAFAATDGSLPTAPPAAFPAPGTKLGHYTVESLLGHGGMGVVFAARDETLGRRVALKLLHAGGDDAARTRLEREAQVMARLSHPNVVTVYALGEWAGGRTLAMELVDGLTLDAWQEKTKPSAAAVLRCLLEAGKGLVAAHAAGVVHRDFKPGNVLVGADGRVRVSDFGLSRPAERVPTPGGFGNQLVTQAGTLVGTPAYMSPEQLDGETADARSDQFSFAVTLVEALTGARPFSGTTREMLRGAMRGPPALSGLAQPLKPVVRRMLSEAPAARFPSMPDALAALERAGRHEGKRAPLVASAIGLLLLSLGGAVASVLYQPPPRAPPVPAVSGVAPPAAPVADTRQGTPVPAVIEIERGDVRLLSIPGLERVAVGDPDVLDVKTGDEGELALLAHEVGETTLLAFTADGHRHSWTVRVVPQAP